MEPLYLYRDSAGCGAVWGQCGSLLLRSPVHRLEHPDHPLYWWVWSTAGNVRLTERTVHHYNYRE